MMDVDNHIRDFAGFLTASWPYAVRLAKRSTIGSFLDDWKQANWEILVEASIGDDVFLVVYNGQAECYPDSSRVFRPAQLPTHLVAITPRDGSSTAVDVLTNEQIAFPAEGIKIEELVSLQGGYYAHEPPFELRGRSRLAGRTSP